MQVSSEMESAPSVCMSTYRNNELALAEPRRRRVEVITIPAKDIGLVRNLCLGIVSRLLGSPLIWAMHWAIRVDETYFELQRPGGLAKPCLRSSTWSKEKQQGIITTVPIG